MDMTLNLAPVRDSEGYLIDPETWNPNVAQELAAEENLELDDLGWQIVRFMREYWQSHQVAPDVRHVVEFLVEEQGLDKKSAKEQIFKQFPYGYVKQACKIAGMMRPRAWSTG
ncbi:MAG TPA: TusE/DsrC/DsvC family sulfur relay protein [Parasulfuritortus sp.]